jgi:hypothetical protein
MQQISKVPIETVRFNTNSSEHALTDVQQARQLNKLLKLEDENARGHN